MHEFYKWEKLDDWIYEWRSRFSKHNYINISFQFNDTWLTNQCSIQNYCTPTGDISKTAYGRGGCLGSQKCVSEGCVPRKYILNKILHIIANWYVQAEANQPVSIVPI